MSCLYIHTYILINGGDDLEKNSDEWSESADDMAIGSNKATFCMQTVAIFYA